MPSFRYPCAASAPELDSSKRNRWRLIPNNLSHNQHTPLVLDTIPLIDLCHFLVVLEIIRVLIRELMWVQPEIGVMDKEKEDLH